MTAPIIKWAVFEAFNFWDLLIFAPCFISAIITLYLLVRAFVPFYYIHKVFQHEGEVIETGRANVYDGSPGTGKTLSMTYDGVLLSGYSFCEMIFKKCLQEAKERDKRKPPFDNAEDEKRFNAIRETVDYYKNNPDKIPCLVSNYGVKIGEQFSTKLLKSHYLQKNKLHEGAVTLQDESADILSNQRSQPKGKTDEEKREIAKENDLINETVSKMRHYGDWYMLFAEQDSAENYIGIRRVVSKNRYLTKLIKVCTPDRYIKRFEKIKSKVIRKDFCTDKQYKKAVKLQNLISKIGFFKIYYEDRGNSQKSNKVIDDGWYALPINLPFKYATRAYQLQYKAIDNEINLKEHKSLYLPPKNKKTTEKL